MKIKFIFSLFISLFLGALLTLFMAPLHPWVQQQAATIFKHAFENALGCSVSCRVRTVNLWSPSIEVEDLTVCPRNSDDVGWSWQCKKYTMGFSWYNFIRHGSLDIAISLDGIHAVTQVVNGVPAIKNHVVELLNGPKLPFPSFLQSIVFADASVQVNDPALQGSYYLKWKSESRQLKDRLKSRIYIKKTRIAVKDLLLCADSSGDITVDIQGQAQDVAIVVSGEGRLNIPQFAHDPWCFVQVSYENNSARISVYNASKTLIIDPFILTQRSDGWWFKTKAALPLSFLNGIGLIGKHQFSTDPLLHASIAGTLDGDWMQGEVEIPQLCIASRIPHVHAQSTFEKKGQQIFGDFTAGFPSLIDVSGTWKANVETGQGTFYAEPTAKIASRHFEPWCIDRESAHIKGEFSADKIVATYDAVCTNNTSHARVVTNGNLEYANKIVTVEGAIDQTQKYELQCGLDYPYLHHMFYKRDPNTVAASVESYVEGSVHKFDGLCTIPFIRTLLKELYQYDWQAEGDIYFHGELVDTGARAWIQLNNGTIRLPQTYNFVNGFEGNLFLDWPARKLMVRDLCCTLHEGLARVNQGVLYITDAWEIAYMHMPLVLDRCVLQLKKDFFAMISGSLFGEFRKGEIPTIKGSVVLDRAQLKENIFADEFQKQLFQTVGSTSSSLLPDLACDIAVETKEPVRVDTPFLKTNARIALAISRSLSNPQVIGTIKLLGGELHFPHKPLHITRGSIQFIPDQLNNPLVELVAKNTIKKNIITLYVSGALLNHQILLESTPPLTQEQIISLLMVGSHDDSLNSMMPAFIAHNIKQLIFGGHQSGFLDKYFKPIMQPLSINVVPSFSDQTGRGGLRAGIEITVNDRWRALIQKNFSLTEDTRLELEYLFSDDVSVRAIRDERRDMGAEIEVRFKF